MDDTNHEIANGCDCGTAKHPARLFRLWFGQVGTTHVYCWADSFESAFEVAVEWLDDKGFAGYFVDVTVDDLKEAAEDLGIPWKPEWPQVGVIDDPDYEKVLEHAEADLTCIGHTTLKSGRYIPSYEWGGDDVQAGTDEYREVLARSRDEYIETWPDEACPHERHPDACTICACDHVPDETTGACSRCGAVLCGECGDPFAPDQLDDHNQCHACAHEAALTDDNKEVDHA